MDHEASFLERQERTLITRQVVPFALGWIGALAIWLVVVAEEGRLTAGALVSAVVQGAALALAIARCRADAAAPRVPGTVVATTVVLGVLSIGLVASVGAYGEILAFMLLTLYLASALLFSWGWRAEMALLVVTLAVWALVAEWFVFFVPLPELVAAIAIGGSLSLAIAEGRARASRRAWLRRRAQEEATRAFEASRNAYRDLAESADDLIWTSDRDGRLTYVNEATARFVGRPATEILGRAITDFYTDDPRNPNFEELLARMRSGETLPRFLVQTRTPHGPRWIEVVSSSVRDVDGTLTGFRGISRDVTQRQAAAEALRESEARYRGLVHSQLELVVRLDLEGCVTFANEAYLRKFGLRRSDVLGRALFHLVHPDDVPSVVAAIDDLHHPPHHAVIEIRNLTPDGIRWVSWEGGAVLDEEGRPAELQAVGRDVTERRAAEDALRASEARYRGLVESATELVTRFDLQGRLTFVNDSFSLVIGLRGADILGTSPRFLVHPDDYLEAVTAFEAALRAPYRCRCETRARTPDGWRWFDWEISGVRDEQGRVVEVQQVGRDVTARRQALAALRESEERFRSAFEDAAIGMAVTTLDGRTIRANAALCEMLGYTEDELKVSAIEDVVHPEDRVVLDVDRARLAGGDSRSYRAERRYLRKDGGIIWVHVAASVVRDVNGAPLYLIGQIQDITERHLAEEALRASLVELRRSEEKLRLLAQHQVTIREEERKRVGFDLHDDVCQELVGVGILIESLRRKLAPMPAETAAEFDRVVRYVGEVVEHLRLLARELRPLLLRDLGLDGSLKSLAEGMSTPALRVVTEFRGKIPALDEDTEVTIYRIAQEALGNAVRHAGATRIDVALAVDDGALRLAVRDDGQGFEVGARPAVALGITSMEERAIALGGRLAIRSGHGSGTTVELTCPLGGRPARSLTEPAAPSPRRSSSRLSAATTPRSAARD